MNSSLVFESIQWNQYILCKSTSPWKHCIFTKSLHPILPSQNYHLQPTSYEFWKTWVDKRIETSESRCAFGLPIFTNESLLGDPAMMKHQGWHKRFNKIFYFYTKITKISATEICHLSTYLEPHLTGWKCQPALQTHFFLSKSETSGAFIMAILEEFKNRYLRAEWTFQSAPTRKWGGALPFSCHKTE